MTNRPRITIDEAAEITSPTLQPVESFLDIRTLWFIFLRRKEVIFTIIAFVVFSALTFVLTQTPRYTAEAVIQIDARSSNVVDVESVMGGLGANEAAIAGEIDILRSRALGARVVDKLGLATDPEFNPEYEDGTGGFLGFFKQELDIGEKEEHKRIQRTKTVENLFERVRINRKARSYTIRIRATSESPDKAALIANTFVDEYLISQLQTKFDATERANEWLSSKLGDLQEKLRQSELVVQAFREQHNLIETAGLTVSDQQLSELNTQLILARSGRAQAEARLASAKKDVDTASEVLNSNLIQSLREQEAQVLRKRSELSSRYGKRHPKMINVNTELRDLQSKISLEINKIKQGLDKEVQIAQAREDSLEKSLRQLQGQVGDSTKAKVELAELVREMNANRTLYESFLNRSKETTSKQDLQKADARIISIAEVPLKPTYPRKFLVLLIAGIFGCIAGLLIALLLEHLDNAFTRSAQLENMTGVACIGMIPLIESKLDFVSYVVTKLSSVYVEALRSTMNSVYFSSPDNPPKSLLVTSSVPEEGKTTFSVTLAAAMAKSGKKVLIIDCDLKRPAVASRLGVGKVKHSLDDYIAGKATIKDIIHVEKKSGLHFISSHANTPNSQDILSSKKMATFLKSMKTKYDLVILDTPPVMAVSDALVMTDVVDSAIFVVRWNKTPRPIVVESIKILQKSNIKLAGAALSNVDLDKYAKYGYGDQGYYYQNYREYYTS